MARRHYKLPSLTGLNTFDACARHGSLTQAAGELGVTLGAVSRQIKALEHELNAKLFTRHYRGVELTDSGQALHQVLAKGFRDIGHQCDLLSSRGKTSDVTIAATTAFASLWLMPRLGSFWAEHQEIMLNHAISDNPHDTGFMEADIRIRYGYGNWPGEVATKLFDEVIYPVCGPGFAADHCSAQAADLQFLPLLRLESLDPEWTDWDNCLAQWRLDPSSLNFRRFNNYVVALQAAEENQGVVLGWHSLVEPLIRAGRLVRFGELKIDAPGCYYLSWHANRSLTRETDLLRQWLINNCQGTSD